MRDKDSAFATLLAADELNLVVLVEIQRATTPLRYAIDAHPRTWNGVTWEPTGGKFDEVQESAEREVPGLQLVLQNVDGVLGPLVYEAAGGEDLRGKRVTLYEVSRDLLAGEAPEDLAVGWTLFIEDYMLVGRHAVAFGLGVFPAAEVDVPNRTLQGLRCRWWYKGRHCGYDGDLPTCAKTREDCARHFEGEPLRFGGFPTSSGARVLRVD